MVRLSDHSVSSNSNKAISRRLPSCCYSLIGAYMLGKLKVYRRIFHPQLRSKKGNLREWTYCLYLRYGAMKEDEYSCTQQL